MADTSIPPVGGNGVFITTREIFDTLTRMQTQLSRMEGQISGAIALQSNYALLEERVRKVEGWTKALPPAIVLVLISIVFALIKTSGA